MRQVNMRASIAKAELQHSHAGNLVLFTKSVNIGSNVAEVLGKEWQPSQFLVQLVEEFVARAIDPTAIYRSFFGGRNFPELGEAAKVVKTHEVAGLRSPAQALYPPLEAARAHHVPPVQGIAPALAGRAEGI